MNYTCPYCNRDTTLSPANIYHSQYNRIYIEKSELGNLSYQVSCKTCPNTECKKLSLSFSLHKLTAVGETYIKPIQFWNLLPESTAKVIPEYVPEIIRKNYYQACRIKDLAPGASATLSRGCLQGMIRDFHKISKPRLIDEIKALENIVDKDVWDSIEAVRKVGNIGAHMEKDINVIIEVAPEEAQLLISLIEQLIEDWYVNRENRKNRAEALKKLAEDKESKKIKS